MPIHFIELTSLDKEPLLLCVNHILYFQPYEDSKYLRIELVSGGFVEVRESYAEVKKMINTRTFIEERNARRKA